MKARFEAVKEEGYAWVRDNHANEYRMPERAVSINMHWEAALEIARRLNNEWTRFVRKPY